MTSGINKKTVLITVGAVVGVILLVVGILTLVNLTTRLRPNDARVIADISFENNPHLGYTVYVMENGRYIPYLVLTHDYNGYTLLLRKHLLDEFMRYSYTVRGGMQDFMRITGTAIWTSF